MTRHVLAPLPARRRPRCLVRRLPYGRRRPQRRSRHPARPRRAHRRRDRRLVPLKPVSAVAIGAHLAGAVQLLRTESHRIARQDGVARSSAVRTGLTAAALGTTAYSGVLNRKMAAAGNVPAQGATEAGAGTPPDIAKTLKQLQAVQWLIPGLTGSLVTATAWQSEQMRPKQMLAGILPGSR